MNTYKFIPEGWNDEINSISDQDIFKYKNNQEILQARVDSCDENYNLHIEFANGIKAIMPREEIEAINLESNGLPKENICTGKINKYVQFKVKDIKEDNSIILSRKLVQEEALSWVRDDLEVGQTVNGIVKNIRPYGVFVEIGGGVVGLAHIEDLSVARIKSPYERVKIGQKLNIVVKSIDKEQGKVILSYKEMLGSWEDNIRFFQEGDKVKGIVRETEKNKNGIFVELKPNLVGMAEYQEDLEYGQEVEVCIKKIIPEKQKIKLLIV